MFEKELVRVWKNEPFKLEIFDLHRRDDMGRWLVEFHFYVGSRCILSAEQSVPTCDTVDGDNTVRGILFWVSLRDSDIPPEAGDEGSALYGGPLMDWFRQEGFADQLHGLVIDLEEEINREREGR